MQIKTKCKDCIFAIYTNNTQTGCEAGRLQQYEDFGMVNYQIDPPLTYAEIGGVCMYCRNHKWAEQHPRISNMLEHIRNLIKIKYNVILLTNNNIDDTILTLKSLSNQYLKPCHINLVRFWSSTITPAEYISVLRDIDIPWKIENMIDKNTTEREAVDIVATSNVYPYYTVIHSGFEVPKYTYSAIDSAINDYIQPIVVLKPNKDGNGLFVNNTAHKVLFGSRDKNIEDKLECPAIYEIYPEFPK